MPCSMSKISAIFRCPLEDYQELEAICKTNCMDISRCVLSAVLMLVDECEAEGIISPSPAESGEAAGSLGEESV